MRLVVVKHYHLPVRITIVYLITLMLDCKCVYVDILERLLRTSTYVHNCAFILYRRHVQPKLQPSFSLQARDLSMLMGPHAHRILQPKRNADAGACRCSSLVHSTVL